MTTETEVIEGEETGEAVGTGNDDRVALLNRIGDQNDTGRAEELAHVNDDGSTEPFSVDETTQAELNRAEEEANQEASEEEKASEPVVQPAEKKYKIKVNGVERELSEEELIARAQKVENADMYLSEAARLRRQAEQTQQPNPEERPTQGRTQPELSPEDERALVRAIQMGTEDEAAAALKTLRESITPRVNPEEMDRRMDERLSFREALFTFQRDYQDVWQDPVLRNMAMSADQQLVAQGDKRGYLDRFTAIGNDIRAWRDSIAGKVQATKQPEATPPTDTKTRQERKAAAPKSPTQANSRAPASVTEDEGEEDASEVIAKMAKSRGGPQWMRS